MPGFYQPDDITFNSSNTGTTVILEGSVTIIMNTSQKITVGNGARFSIVGSSVQPQIIKAGPSAYIESASDAPLFDIVGGSGDAYMSLKNLSLIGKYIGSDQSKSLITLNSSSGLDDHIIIIDACYLQSTSSSVAIIDTANNAAQTTVQIRDSFLYHLIHAIRIEDLTTKSLPNRLKDIKLQNNTFYSKQGNVTGSFGHVEVNSDGTAGSASNILASGNAFWTDNTPGAGGSVWAILNLSNNNQYCNVNAITSNVSNRHTGYGLQYTPVEIPFVGFVSFDEPNNYVI
jgi:hypothetical protein